MAMPLFWQQGAELLQIGDFVKDFQKIWQKSRVPEEQSLHGCTGKIFKEKNQQESCSPGASVSGGK
jgi:hypothetical protein